MRHRAIVGWLVASMAMPATAGAGDWLLRKPRPGEAVTLEQVAKELDCVEDQVLDDGTVVIKHPDVYGQSRMTLYRKNFETQLYGAITKFDTVISARVFRSDQAALASQTSLQATLAAGGGGGGGRRRGGRGASAATSAAPSNTTVVNTPSPDDGGNVAVPPLPQNVLAPNSIVRPSGVSPFGPTVFSQPFASAKNPYGLGVEPTVYLDELADFQNHLNAIRRVNMGDDIADSAGYGLYLIRMPVSLQPGHCTDKGHGAVLTATIRHEFAPDFLTTTFRDLAINDLVDQLSPILYELIRSDALALLPGGSSSRRSIQDRYIAFNKGEHYNPRLIFYSIFQDPTRPTLAASQPPDLSHQLAETNPAGKVTALLSRMASIYAPITRTNEHVYAVAPTEVDNVFLEQNLVMLAVHARDSLQTVAARATEVRSFLHGELEAAYDIISGLYGRDDPESQQVVAAFEAAVEQIRRDVRARNYYAIYDDFRTLAACLPGELRYVETMAGPDGTVRHDPNSALINPLVILCYAVAVESGLLNQQLQLDMKRVLGRAGVDCAEVDAMHFYAASPAPEVEARFEEYVRARWPLITFALSPFVDEQNIADAADISRDLQLAMAFAFSTGQIGFNQLVQYQRRVSYDAEAIALNQTVTSFTHGNDTFGFRFRPRFQNPPPEANNFQAVTNQLIKGWPGRNYQLKNSKLEPGQRELTAVVIVPSFLQAVSMEVTGNWFPLDDPDRMMTPTKRMIVEGRKVVELREALACLHDHKVYRAGDVQRIATRIDQVEKMLPMQTHSIRVPYENTLGGFQLFQQGTSALVPQLDGFEGAEAVVEGEPTDLLLFGKHFSVQETKVVVGGKFLTAPNLDATQALASAAGALDAASKAGQSGLMQGAGPPGSASQAVDEAARAVADVAQKQALQAKTAMNTPPSPMGAPAPAAAGDPTAANPSVEILSRQVIRIGIPAGVTTTSILDAVPDPLNPSQVRKRNYVEVYVATPNGISNRLLVPYMTRVEVADQQAIGARAANFAWQHNNPVHPDPVAAPPNSGAQPFVPRAPVPAPSTPPDLPALPAPRGSASRPAAPRDRQVQPAAGRARSPR